MFSRLFFATMISAMYSKQALGAESGTSNGIDREPGQLASGESLSLTLQNQIILLLTCYWITLGFILHFKIDFSPFKFKRWFISFGQ